MFVLRTPKTTQQTAMNHGTKKEKRKMGTEPGFRSCEFMYQPATVCIEVNVTPKGSASLCFFRSVNGSDTIWFCVLRDAFWLTGDAHLKGSNSGIARRMNSSNNGTVNAISPWEGL